MMVTRMFERAGLVLALTMLLCALALMSAPVWAAPSVIGDVCDTKCDRCVWDGSFPCV